jgi:hypothetical protein
MLHLDLMSINYKTVKLLTNLLPLFSTHAKGENTPY